MRSIGAGLPKLNPKADLSCRPCHCRNDPDCVKTETIADSSTGWVGVGAVSAYRKGLRHRGPLWLAKPLLGAMPADFDTYGRRYQVRTAAISVGTPTKLVARRML